MTDNAGQKLICPLPTWTQGSDKTKGSIYVVYSPFVRSVVSAVRLRGGEQIKKRRAREWVASGLWGAAPMRSDPMSTRKRLPNRRPSYTETLEVDGQALTATVGFDPKSGQPCELFIVGVVGNFLEGPLG